MYETKKLSHVHPARQTVNCTVGQLLNNRIPNSRFANKRSLIGKHIDEVSEDSQVEVKVDTSHDCTPRDRQSCQARPWKGGVTNW